MEKKCTAGLYYYDPCNEDTTDNDIQAKCGFGMFLTQSRAFYIMLIYLKVDRVRYTAKMSAIWERHHQRQQVSQQ